VAGDWGSGTEEAAAVAAEMMEWESGDFPDLTIHLGDVYYLGGKHEVYQNCLGKADPKTKQEGVEWTYGSQGSFALNGNPEMYAKRNAYFDIFLPKLGMKKAEKTGQGTSFFCLENKDWRIVAVDTGYHSTRQVCKRSSRLPKPLMKWLARVIPDNDSKATILLSHHQYFSAFEDDYSIPARQLSRFFGKWPVLWLWGHVHRLAAYDLNGLDGVRLAAHGRCLGHGGMPVEINPPSDTEQKQGAKKKLLFYDRRANPFYADCGEELPIGINGFAQLFFDGPTLTIRHKSLLCGAGSETKPIYPTSTTLVTEIFRCERPHIHWQGLQTPNQGIEGFHIARNWKDRISPPANADLLGKNQPTIK
jgi:hypothetical protein